MLYLSRCVHVELVDLQSSCQAASKTSTNGVSQGHGLHLAYISSTSDEIVWNVVKFKCLVAIRMRSCRSGMPCNAKVISLVQMLHMRRMHGQTKSIMLEGSQEWFWTCFEMRTGRSISPKLGPKDVQTSSAHSEKSSIYLNTELTHINSIPERFCRFRNQSLPRFEQIVVLSGDLNV